MQIPYNTTTTKLRKVSSFLGIPDYQARPRKELMEILNKLLNTNEAAQFLISKKLKLLPDDHPNRSDYFRKTDPYYVQNYTYSSLSVGDILHLESLIVRTTPRCKLPNLPLYRRKDLVKFISNRLNDPYYNIKYFNAALQLFSNQVKHRPLTPEIIQKCDFLLPQKETYILVDRILSDPELRKRSMKLYELKSKQGRKVIAGYTYLKPYITHTFTYNVGEFFRFVGFSKTKFFFSIYLRRCREKNLIKAYINLCALWKAYLNSTLHLEKYRLKLNREYAEILYPELC